MPYRRAPVLLLFGLCACLDSALVRTPDAGSGGKDSGEAASDMQIRLDAGVSAPDIGGDTGGPVQDAGVNGGMDSGMDAGPDAGSGAPDLGPQAPSCAIDLQPQLSALAVPGLTAALVKDGRVVCTAVAGQADIETQRPVEPKTVFAWASVSKTVTAVAALILHEQGEFALDDPVEAHLPFPVRNPECPGGSITFRQLLTHASSIIDNAAVYEPLYTVGESPVALRDFVEGYFTPGGAYYDAEENFDYECPGEYYDYSNVAVALLGYLVEHISGMPFDQFCRAQIFDPLGMTEASFHLAPLDLDNIAMPYDRNAGAFTAHGHVGLPTVPDGALRTSAPSLARFLAMVSQGGILDGRRILSAATVSLMLQPQIPALEASQGLIWYTESFGVHQGLRGHNGSDPGTSSLMFFNPADSSGALLAGNAEWFDASEAAANQLFEALLTEAQQY